MKDQRIGARITVTKGKKHVFTIEDTKNAVRVIQIDDLRGDNNIKYTADKRGVEVDENDIIIAWDGANAGTVGYGKIGFIGSTLARIRLKNQDEYNSAFIARFLASKNSVLRATATGATIPHLSRKALDNLLLPKITLPNQRRIAEVLMKCESLITKRKESIAILDDLLMSTFLEIFGDPVRNERGWDTISIGDAITDIESGVSYGGVEKKKLESDELGVLKISAVTKGIFNATEFKAVKKKNIHKPLIKVKKGMFLFSRANTRELVAACCIVKEDHHDLFIPDKLWSLTINEELINPTFLNYIFKNQNYRNLLRREASGGHDSMLNISMKKFRKLSIIKPDGQNEFAQIADRFDNIRMKYIDSLNEITKLYASITQGAFKGELDLSKLAISDIEDSMKEKVEEVKDDINPRLIRKKVPSDIKDSGFYLNERCQLYVDKAKQLRSEIYESTEKKVFEISNFRHALTDLNSIGEEIHDEVKGFSPWQIDQNRSIERFLNFLPENILEEYPFINLFSRNRFRYEDMTLDEYSGVPDEVIAQYGSLEESILDLPFFFKKYFSNRSFSIQEVKEVYDRVVYERGEWFKYEEIKGFIFKALEGDDNLLTQEFETKEIIDEETGESKLDKQIFLKVLS